MATLNVLKGLIGKEDLNLGTGTFTRLKSDGTSQTMTKVDVAQLGGIEVFNVKNATYGASGDNLSDDTTAIQAAITAAGVSGGTVFFPDANYLAGTLTVGSNVRLLADHGATLKLKNTTNAALLDITASSTNITIDGLILDGNRANQSSLGSNCIAANGVTDLTVKNCEIKSSFDNGIELLGTNSRIRVINNRFADNGGDGMELRGCSNVVVAGNIFDDWGLEVTSSDAIEIQEATSDLTIVNNIFNNTTSTWFAIEPAGGAGIVTGATISGNVFNGDYVGVSGRFNDTVISNNCFVGSTLGTHREGIECVGFRNSITGNTISNGTIAVGSTDTQKSKDISITGNSVSVSALNGKCIQIGQNGSETGTHVLRGFTVSGNVCNLTGSTGSFIGIQVGKHGVEGEIHDVAVTGNTITGGDAALGSGVRMLGASGSDNIFIANNVITTCSAAIESDAETTNVIVRNNDVRGCTNSIVNSGASTSVEGNIFSGIVALADDATPSVLDGSVFKTGGTTTVTDFDDGYEGKIIRIISEHAITITDGTNIFLNGSANFVMAASDTLTLVQKADTFWYEVSRSVN